MRKTRSDLQDLTGMTFGRLGVIELAHRAYGKGRRTMWRCVCVCGAEKLVGRYQLIGGQSKSCGCYGREATGNRARTHGLTKTRTYRIWVDMRRRCYEPDEACYPNYGGRGIKVCERWRDPHGGFERFLADMGEATKGYTLDRINNDGDYEPSNCRWATYKEQHRNKRTNRIEYLNGIGKPLSEWVELYGANYYRVLHRLRAGWSFEDAMFRPKNYQPHGKRACNQSTPDPLSPAGGM